MTKEVRPNDSLKPKKKRCMAGAKTFAFAWLLIFIPFDLDGFLKDFLSIFSSTPHETRQIQNAPSPKPPVPDFPLNRKAGANPAPPISESGSDPANPTGDPPPN